MNPLDKIRDDRVQARRLEDANSDICFLALADKDGRASVRTLVLREVRNNRFLLFMNKSSPKWQILESGGHYELLLWYPSMQRQYRVSGDVEACEPDFVRQSWLRRPRGSKYLDILYEEVAPQSSVIASREELVSHIGRIRSGHNVDDMTAPDKVAGVELVANRIEMLDLNREDRIHDRRVFDQDGDDWQETTIVP